MDKWKKVCRTLILMLLIILAGFGIGLGGAAPVSLMNRKRNAPPIVKTELVEKKKENKKSLFEIK